MKNSTLQLASIVCFILVTGVLRAQPWPPSPLVPPDTTTYSYRTEFGNMVMLTRPPDSMIHPGDLIIRFRDGALDSNTLSQTYWDFFYGHDAKHKGGERLFGGPYDGVNQPRGFFVGLRELLFAERFGLDSSNNVVKDPTLTAFLTAMGGHTLRRLTAASPIDTLSITRAGDTIGCDLYCWMILNMDSTTNPLLLSGLLMSEFPHDIVEAWPDYYCTALSLTPGNSSFACQVGDTMINTPIAWNYEVGDSNILVAHYDLGIDYRHPDFIDSVVGAGHKFTFTWNYWTNSPISYDTNVNANMNDHGTACMGILAGQTNRDSSTATSIAGGWGKLPGGTDTIERGRGVSAVALGDQEYYTADYIAAVFEASARSPLSPFGLGVHVINSSFTIKGGINSPMHCALNYAYENGVVQTAANGENGSGGQDTIQTAYPANYDPDWIICVGSSINDKSRVFQCDYGFSLDLLAPGGDPEFGNCGLPNLNWTARDSGLYFYNGYGGTSIAAPNVAGSASLLLSTFYRQDPAHLHHAEPEDVERILEAAAWRNDRDRDTLPSKDTWRPNSGFGHLDIGNVYLMMDTTSSLPLSHYRLMHYSITDTNDMSFSDWYPSDTGSVQQIFQIPTDARINENPALGKYRERTYLLNYCGGKSDYEVRWRLVTAGMNLGDSLSSTSVTPLFAWGRSGGPMAKSGWSLATENFQTGFSSVMNGSGGDTSALNLPAGLEEGIFFTHGDSIVVQTVQYQVFGWDTTNGTFDINLGHCPQDSELGLNFSVFARPPHSQFRERMGGSHLRFPRSSMEL